MKTSNGVVGIVREWRRYQSYTDSGVPWLKAIPVGWNAVRLKFLAGFCGGGTPSKDNVDFWNGDIPWVSPKDMKSEFIEDTEDHISEAAVENSSTRLIPAGVVLVVVRSGILRHSIPVAIPKKEMALNQDMRAIIPKECLRADYLAAVIRGHENELLSEWCKQGATVESIEVDFLVNTVLPLPSVNEQGRITAFLDLKTARIDALMAKKERLIELLQEKRTALISHAVTKGLDASVPMKDSGVEWLGKIPAHWQVKPLGRVVTVSGGSTPLRKTLAFGTELFGVSPKDMKRLMIDDTEDHITNDALRETNIALIQSMAVLIVIRGMILARDFPVAVNTVPVTINQDMKALRPSPSVVALYLAYQLKVIQEAFFAIREESGHGTKCLRTELWKGVSVAVPPSKEQAVICTFIEARTVRIDALISKVHEAIEKLREYRTALISAAVTGKIDVREEVG